MFLQWNLAVAEVLRMGLSIRPEDRIQGVKELTERLDAALKDAARAAGQKT